MDNIRAVQDKGVRNSFKFAPDSLQTEDVARLPDMALVL